jgi:hypothetical protein
MSIRYTLPLFLAFPFTLSAQQLVDSIPLPGVSQGFWGIHVTADTIFLGADFSGDVYFADHEGTMLGQQPTGFTFNHGLIRRPQSYLIAQDYTTNGAHLYEVGLDGTLLNTWTFPDVIGGHSSGIGDICVDGDAIWYTMYYPDFDVYPYAYAYKWVPGDAAPIDTVPMLGAQPHGIVLKGDTLLYVVDDNDDDPERLYLYDLTNEEDLGFVELPDADGDQSPRGLSYDGTYLYLVANRTGGSAFAYQTILIYAFDASVGLTPTVSPAALYIASTPEGVTINGLPADAAGITIFSASGAAVLRGRTNGATYGITTSGWARGAYTVHIGNGSHTLGTVRFVVE